MKEQLFILQAAGLAIPRQTVYAEYKGQKAMPDATVVESTPRTEPKPKETSAAKTTDAVQKEEQAASAQEKALKAKDREKPTKPRRVEDAKRELKPHLDQFKKMVREEMGQMEVVELKREIVNLHRLAAKIEKGMPRSERKQLWEDVHESVKEVYDHLEKQGVAVPRFIDREFLVHEENGNLVLPPDEIVRGYWEKVYREGRVSREEADEGIRKNIPPVAGGAEPLNVLEFDDERLRDIALEINDEIERVGIGNPLPPDVIRDQTNRIRTLVDERRVDSGEARRILQSLGGWREEAGGIDEEEEVRIRNREGVRRASYTDELLTSLNIRPEIYESAAVRVLAERLIGTPVDNRNMDLVRGVFNELSDMRERLAVDLDRRPEYEEAGSLLTSVDRLRRKMQEEQQAIMRGDTEDMRSLYGEIKLRTPEMRDLVSLALQSGGLEDDTNWRIVRERFNKLFARADFNSGDPWQEALGTAGSIEIDQFLATLENAATGRVSYGDLAANLREEAARERLKARARQLRAEYEMRQSLHNINFMANKGFPTEKIAESASSFSGEQADLAYKSKGVAMISRFYDQAMFEIIHAHKGHLPYAAMVNQVLTGQRSEVETRVLARVKLTMKANVIEPMEQWEIDRALSLSRGMGIMSGRFFEIVAMAGVSQSNPLDSWWANDVVKNLAFFKQLARYNVGVQQNKFLTYDFENRKFYWSLDQLPKDPADNLGKYVQFGMTVGDPKYRTLYVNRTNPFKCGSIYTQTAWRYGNPEDDVTLDEAMYTNAVATMLVDNPENPLIGIGMWVEKLKNDIRLKGHDHETRTKKENAHRILHNVLALSTDVAPLKLYSNLPWFKEQVDAAMTSAGAHISEDDLMKLGIIQEELTQRRIEKYKMYLENPEGQPPDMYREETNLNYNIIVSDDDPQSRQQAERLRRFVQTLKHQVLEVNSSEGKLGVDQILYDLEHRYWEVPFIMGVDDLPLELYNFTATGGTTLKRRWGDINSASDAVKPYEQMVRGLGSFKKPEDLAKHLKTIYDTLAAHDESVTREVMYHTIEGLTLYFKKDLLSRQGLGMGTLYGAISGQASYAQKALGRQQMAWDESDCRDFIFQCRELALISKEQGELLIEHTGARAVQTYGIDLARSVGPLLLAAFLLYIATKVSSEK